MAAVSSTASDASTYAPRRVISERSPLTKTQPISQQPRGYNNAYLPNGGPHSGPVPGAAPLLPNQGRVIQQGSVRILCIADVRGKLHPSLIFTLGISNPRQ